MRVRVRVRFDDRAAALGLDVGDFREVLVRSTPTHCLVANPNPNPSQAMVANPSPSPSQDMMDACGTLEEEGIAAVMHEARDTLHPHPRPHPRPHPHPHPTAEPDPDPDPDPSPDPGH